MFYLFLFFPEIARWNSSGTGKENDNLSSEKMERSEEEAGLERSAHIPLVTSTPMPGSRAQGI